MPRATGLAGRARVRSAFRSRRREPARGREAADVRIAKAVVGIVMTGAGGVWCLQGVRVLPGSFMTGSPFWAVTGAVVGLAGVAVFLDATRRPAH